MKGLRRVVMLLAGLPAISLAGDCSLQELAWLAGHWRSELDGRVAEEVWLAPLGGMMVAVGRTAPDAPERESATGKRVTAFHEYLRIEDREPGLVLIAAPLGGTGTEFPLVDCGPQQARFANPDHDFPQVIIYHRKNNQLQAITTGSGRPAQTFRWLLVED